MKTALTDLLSYRFVSAPHFSPDGRAVAFLTYRASADKRGYDAIVRVINPENGANLPFRAPQGASSLAWLENGALAVALVEEGATSLYASDGGGRCALWGRVPFEAALLAGVRGNRLLLRAQRPITPEKANEDGHFTILDEYPFWDNGRGYISKLRRQLLVMDEGGLPVLVSPESLDVTQAAYDPASGIVAYAGQTVDVLRPDWEAVYAWDSQSGENRALINRRWWHVCHLAVLDGCAVIAAVGADDSRYATPEILMVQEDGRWDRISAPGMHIGNGIVSDVRYGEGTAMAARDGFVYFVATEGFGAQLYRLSREGVLSRLSEGLGSVDGFDVYGGQVVFSGLRDMHLAELYRLEGLREVPLTQLNGQTRADMARELSFVNAQGSRVWGLVRCPDEPQGGKCPAVLVIHGGPGGAFGHVFHHEIQTLSAMGYYVLYANPTGSQGRGAAFADLGGRWGTVDYEDILAFTDAALAAYPQIDPQRVAVSGGSYGGYLVNWIIGHTPFFCCAIADRSISNCPSMEITGDAGPLFGLMSVGGSVYTDPKAMWARSPLKYAHQVKTPTLFIHGEEDRRCHVSQSMMMYTAIRENEVPARMAVFKGENHDLCRAGKPVNRLRRLDEMVKWLQKYCQ